MYCPLLVTYGPGGMGGGVLGYGEPVGHSEVVGGYVDGSELGTKLGSSLGTELGSALGLLLTLGVELGPELKLG